MYEEAVDETAMMKSNVLVKGALGFRGPGGGFPRNGEGQHSLDRYKAKLIGLWLFLATAIMLFAAVTSALIIRRAAPDWKFIKFPEILWLNTGLLLLSSITLDVSRRCLQKSWLPHRFWFSVTLLFGFAFLAGQIYVWKILESQGLFLPTNPHGSFFYLITCLHGFHLTGGLIWLLARFFLEPMTKNVVEQERSLTLAAIYWHFLDVLWILLFILLLAL